MQIVKMYCSTMTTIKSYYFIYTFIALLATKCCYGRQVNKRRAAGNAFALLSTVGNVVLEKNVQGIWRAGCGPRAVVWLPLQSALVSMPLLNSNSFKVFHVMLFISNVGISMSKFYMMLCIFRSIGYRARTLHNA